MLPPGYTARPLEFDESGGLPDGPDVDLAYAVTCAADIALLGRPDDTREARRFGLTSLDAVREEHRLVLDSSGAPVGLLMVERDPEIRAVFLEPYAVPGHADLLVPLLRMGLEAAQRVRGEGEWRVDTAAWAQDHDAIATITETGFTPKRRFWTMTADVSGLAHEDPEPPPGVTRSVAATEEERRILHRVDQESFADHFDFAPHPYEDWMPWFTDRRDARPDTWWVAWLDGEPVGLCMADDRKADGGRAYIRTLGVVPQARGRGIATWLLRSAFAQAAREGRTGVSLGVDSENPTGAVRLYEKAGMRAEQVVDMFSRPL